MSITFLNRVIGFRRWPHRDCRPRLWYRTSVFGASRRLYIQKKRVRSSDCQVTIDTSTV